MLRRIVPILVGVVLLAVGCSQGESTDAQATTNTSQATTSTTAAPNTSSLPPTTTSVAQGCSAIPIAPGDYEAVGEAGVNPRPYWVVVPESYAPPTPVPLYVHLASGSGDHDAFYAGWRPYLDNLSGIMVLVNTSQGGDPDELATLIDEVVGEYCVDPNRIHVMGTSWSGGMAEMLACRESETVASFVSALSNKVPVGSCSPTRQVPLLTYTGDTDRQWIDELVDRWVGINDCDPEPSIADLGSGVLRKVYRSCTADVVYIDIDGLGHAWPMHEAKGPGASMVAEYAEVDYLEETLAFFADHPLP